MCVIYALGVSCGKGRLLSWIFSMLLLEVGSSEISSAICALAGLPKCVSTKVVIGKKEVSIFCGLFILVDGRSF
jgi:hypothetical protein